MLQFVQAQKSYGQQLVIRIPALQLDKGVYWLQGINGSGKTTLLRMIAGLIPFEGDILFEATSLRHKPLFYRRSVSWAEAEPLYPAFIIGQELVAFYQDIRKASFLQIDKLIDLFRIEQYLSMPIGSYSSGTIKKLSLLLAFIGNPSLILLDEPLATLDAEAALLLPELIREYRQDLGVSFVFSSHQTIITGSLSIDKKLVISDQTIHLAACA
jgi:ABC-2 type transport system ATP-binding protein